MPIGKVKALDPGFTPTEQRQREQLLRQFTHTDGPQGNSEQFLDAWDLIFAKGLTDEQKAEIEKRWRERLE